MSDVIKGLVLAGGLGTRLRPLTFTRAKQLIPVGNKPVLFYGLEDLAAAGIRQVGMVVGDTREEIRQAVGDGSRWGLDITYINQPEPLGLAHAVKVARPYLGSEPFIMYLGDNILKHGVRSILEKFRRERPAAYILLARVRDPQRFGVAVLEEDRVVRLVEKPKEPPSDLALVGVYIFDHRIHEVIDTLQPSWRGEYEITDAIQGLIEQGLKVRYDIVQGWWKDTGHLEDLLEANRLVLEDLEPRMEGMVENSEIEGRVVVGAGTRIVASHLRGPLVIGTDCYIEHAFIGPFTAIQDRVTVVCAEVEYSIILSDCEIREIPYRIASSLLGNRVRLEHGERKPRCLRLMLGDQSWVDIP